jgi:hypothetical protein
MISETPLLFLFQTYDFLGSRSRIEWARVGPLSHSFPTQGGVRRTVHIKTVPFPDWRRTVHEREILCASYFTNAL